MSLIAFLRESLRGLHGALEEAVRDLTPAQLHWRPNDLGAHIAFNLWHYVRTEDNVVRFVLQRRPTVWMEGGWHERFGLDAKAQGTGMSPEAAAAVRLPSVEAFLPYMLGVWRATEEYLDASGEGELERLVKLWPHDEVPVRRALGNVCLTHGYSHLGEIWHLRALQGLKGSPV